MRFSDLVKFVRADKKLSPKIEHCTIFTNPNWRPNKLDCTPKGGIAPGEPQNKSTRVRAKPAQDAQRAIVQRFLSEIEPGRRLSLREWIQREKTKRAATHEGDEKRGLGQLTADLLGLDYASKGISKHKGYLALRRSLERAGAPVKAGRKEEHGTIKNEDYRQRIADLQGAELGNPFAPDRDLVGARLERSRVEFKVRGDWQLSDDVKFCHAFTTKLQRVHSPIYESDEEKGPSFYDVLLYRPDLLVESVGAAYAECTGVEVVLLKLRAIEIVGEFPTLSGPKDKGTDKTDKGAGK